jgi:prephenate dehydrogenase
MTDIDGRRIVAVVGTGLVGTSIGLSLHRAGWGTAGFDRCRDTAQRARSRGAFDAIAGSIGQLVSPATDLVIVCVPPEATVATVEAVLAAGARAVTDVASVKRTIVGALSGHAGFLGGHPMAGGETEGPDRARPDLFEGANWLLTRGAATGPGVVEVVVRAVEDMGARPVMLDPETHDLCVALVSHLPHVAAAALASVLAHASGAEEASRLVAKGWGDTTRVASGPSRLWAEILDGNAEAVGAAIDALIVELRSFRESLQAHDRETLRVRLGCAAATRDALLGIGQLDLAQRRARRLAGTAAIPACTCGLRHAG